MQTKCTLTARTFSPRELNSFEQLKSGILPVQQVAAPLLPQLASPLSMRWLTRPGCDAFGCQSVNPHHQWWHHWQHWYQQQRVVVGLTLHLGQLVRHQD